MDAHPMTRYSEHHIAQYRQYYEERLPRLRPHRWQAHVEQLAADIEARSVLDYGCSEGGNLARFSSLPVVCYDPGISKWAGDPEPADLVVCLHVLEHVELGYVHAVLRHLWSLAQRAALLVVSCQPSTKCLPDGTPWHTLVRPPEWWEAYLSRFWPVTPFPVLDPRPGYEWACVLRRGNDAPD